MRAPWIIACLLGEALGIAAVAIAYAALDRGVFHAQAWILLAGAWEGLALGAAQALVLRRANVRPLPWVAWTTAGAVAGYALSLLGGAGEGPASVSEPVFLLPVLLGAGLGAVMGALMGLVQWLAARQTIAALTWIGLNALGWAPAMAIILLAASGAERTWPLHVIAVVGAVAGVSAGAMVGDVTSFGVPRSARTE